MQIKKQQGCILIVKHSIFAPLKKHFSIKIYGKLKSIRNP